MMDYGNDYKVRRKSVTKDGVTKDVSITEVENGFIVCVTTSYMEGEEYKIEKKKWISKSDPMPDKENKEEKEPQTAAQAIKSINF
jgi:hypothetical protein